MKSAAQRCVLMVAAGVCVATLSACNNAPRGDSGGIIDARERTGADRYDPAADTVSLLEFADKAAEDLAGQIARIPEIKNSPTQVIIEIGSLRNMTRTTSSADFEALQRRVVTTLVRSDLAREVAQVRENIDRVQRDAAPHTAPAQVDPLGRSAPVAGGPGVEASNLDFTYFLNGTFSELSRGDGVQSTYLLDFTLTKGTTRQIIWVSPKYDIKQFRN